MYYGDQAYGVEAAALNYFGVTAAKLNLGQAALLAGIVQQPTAYNPVLNPEAAQARRNLVLDRMQALGLASAKDVTAAKKVDVKKVVKRKPAKGVCHRSPSRTSVPTSWSGCRSHPRWPCWARRPPSASRRSTRVASPSARP